MGPCSGPLCSSEGPKCPPETNMHERTIQPQASAPRRPLGPHPHGVQLPACPRPLGHWGLETTPPRRPSAQGCAHTSPSRPRRVDPDSSVVLIKPGWRSPARFPVKETEVQRVKELPNITQSTKNKAGPNPGFLSTQYDTPPASGIRTGLGFPGHLHWASQHSPASPL